MRFKSRDNTLLKNSLLLQNLKLMQLVHYQWYQTSFSPRCTSHILLEKSEGKLSPQCLQQNMTCWGLFGYINFLLTLNWGIPDTLLCFANWITPQASCTFEKFSIVSLADILLSIFQIFSTHLRISCWHMYIKDMAIRLWFVTSLGYYCLCCEKKDLDVGAMAVVKCFCPLVHHPCSHDIPVNRNQYWFEPNTVCWSWNFCLQSKYDSLRPFLCLSFNHCNSSQILLKFSILLMPLMM